MLLVSGTNFVISAFSKLGLFFQFRDVFMKTAESKFSHTQSDHKVFKYFLFQTVSAISQNQVQIHKQMHINHLLLLQSALSFSKKILCEMTFTNA